MTPKDWLNYIEIGTVLEAHQDFDNNTESIHIRTKREYKIHGVHWLGTGLYIDIIGKDGHLQYSVPVPVFDLEYNRKRLQSIQFNNSVDEAFK